jgi:hypothetical protein
MGLREVIRLKERNREGQGLKSSGLRNQNEAGCGSMHL